MNKRIAIGALVTIALLIPLGVVAELLAEWFLTTDQDELPRILAVAISFYFGARIAGPVFVGPGVVLYLLVSVASYVFVGEIVISMTESSGSMIPRVDLPVDILGILVVGLVTCMVALWLGAKHTSNHSQRLIDAP